MSDNFTPEEDGIILRKMQEAKEEIDAGRAKSAAQRRAEEIRAEQDADAAQVVVWQKHPSRYEAELKAWQERDAKRIRELQQTGAEKPVDPGTAAGIRVQSKVDKRFQIAADGTLLEV